MFGKRGRYLGAVTAAVIVLGLVGPAMAVDTTVTESIIGGADSLDVTGNFVFAANFTDVSTDYTIGDATFTHYLPGTTTITGLTTNMNWFSNYETNGYGNHLSNFSGSTDNTNLNHVLNVIGYIGDSGGTP